MQPFGLVVDATSVYWISDDGSVVKVSLCGGAPTTLAAGQHASSLAVDDTGVYWASDRSVATVGKDGGAVSTLATLPLPGGGNIAVRAGEIYVGGGVSCPSSGGDGGPCTGGIVVKLPVGGGAVTTLASQLDSVGGLAVDDADVYFVTTQQLEYGGPGKDALVEMPLAGGTVSTLTTNPLASGPVTGGGRVYWYNDFKGDYLSVPSGGGTVVTTASGQLYGRAFAVNGGSVYFAEEVFDVIEQVPLGGSVPTTLASARGLGRNVAVDDAAVYFTASTSVLRVALK